MRSALIVATTLLAVVTVAYLIPGLIELEMLHFHVSPWFCVFFGDLTGCYLLAVFGYKRTAIAIYVLATTIEARFLMLKSAPVVRLVWMTDLAPTLMLVAAVLSTFWIVLADPVDRRNQAVNR